MHHRVRSPQEPKVVEFRAAITEAVENKHGDTMTKMGALLAAGIVDAGGRNCTLRYAGVKAEGAGRGVPCAIGCVHSVSFFVLRQEPKKSIYRHFSSRTFCHISCCFSFRIVCENTVSEII